MSEIISIDAAQPNPEIIRRACALLEAGELVGVPTETVYGIACDPAHLEKLYAAKERDRGKPVARLAASIEQVEELGADLGKDGRRLAEKYWPGPLTLVLNTPDGPTGFRVPDHGIPLALARDFGCPVALTSANKSGDADALNAQEAFQALEPTASDFRASPFSDDADFQCLENPVALYLESFQGSEKSTGKVPSIGKLPSTVVQCLETETKILREGTVSVTEIISD